MIPEIQAILPSRIQKIYQISQNEILFQVHSKNSGKQQILISCHSLYNRILLTKRSYPTPKEPNNFVMLLRKHLEGATMDSITQADLDRWCTIKIHHHNQLGDYEELSLIVELMGKYANVILVNQENKILDALKRIPPFENNRRIVHPGAEFKPTPPQDKKNPFLHPIIDPNQSLTQQFSGFSPFLAKEIEYRMSNGQSFEEVLKEIEASHALYIANQANEAVFHCIPLTHVGKCVSYPFFEGFDILYYHKEEKERIKEISGDIFHVVKRELKHQTQKLPRLLKEYDAALDCDKYRRYGDLLYAHQIKDTKGLSEIELLDYETEEKVKIPLDARYDGVKNAQRLFAKYAKLKKGQQYLEEQIEICKREIAYFEGLLEQLDMVDFETAEEMKQELIKGGYMKQVAKKKKPNKKDAIPAFQTITLPNGISISFGKNNLQNDYLTFHYAKKSDLFLHAKDYHGAHVIIHSDEIDEATLRAGAQIAAYFSKGRNSSSVPVNYSLVKDLKRIPGAKPGMVQLTKYKTIFMDPSEEEIHSLGITL